MMIHPALMWPDASDKSLWTMYMAHTVHLHNHITHIYSGIYPEEVCTSSKSYNSDLKNSHPWGCPAYVLEPRLQDGKNFPKWVIRSRRAQYLGACPLNSITVDLVSNLKLATSALNYIWYLMNIFILCMQESINNLHFGKN